MAKETKTPRILIYDIETSPNLGYYFELYKEGNIICNQKDWYILSFAYKWLGESKTNVVSLPDFSLYKKNKEDDRMLVASLWNLFDEADIVIAHNGNQFDQKKASARFIYHGFTPPSPYKQIDTKLEAKRYFKFDSNKLNDLGKYLGLGEKLQTGGFELWKNCMLGDKKAWKKMCDYNKQDVILLEQVYEKLKPWMRTHPNVSIGVECPKCKSTKIQWRGTAKTSTKIYARFQCQDCGGWGRSTTKLGEVNQPLRNI